MTSEYEDEIAETWHVLQALSQLYTENTMWTSNLVSFSRANNLERIQWWRLAKKQAQLGAPAMRTLLLRVIEIKLLE
jgi:hypothetical protein